MFFPRTPSALAPGNGLFDDGCHLVKVHGIFLGHRVADEYAARQAQVPLRFGNAGDLGLVFGVVIYAEAAPAAVERGKVVRAQAQHGNAHGLQILQCQADIQDHLRAGAHHGHRGLAQLLQVGADVHGLFRAAVHTADAARGEHADARQAGKDHRGGYCRRARALFRHHDGKVAPGYLGHAFAFAHQLQFVLRKAHLQHAVDDRHGGGHCALRPHDALHLGRKGKVVGVGHAVGEDRALQRDNGLAVTDGGGDFRRDGQIFFQIHNTYSFTSLATSAGLIAGLMVSALSMAAGRAQRKIQRVPGRKAVHPCIHDTGHCGVACAGGVFHGEGAAFFAQRAAALPPEIKPLASQAYKHLVHAFFQQHAAGGVQLAFVCDAHAGKHFHFHEVGLERVEVSRQRRGVARPCRGYGVQHQRDGAACGERFQRAGRKVCVRHADVRTVQHRQQPLHIRGRQSLF